MIQNEKVNLIFCETRNKRSVEVRKCGPPHTPLVTVSRGGITEAPVLET
jgi:hypothetical protein